MENNMIVNYTFPGLYYHSDNVFYYHVTWIVTWYRADINMYIFIFLS